MDTVLFGNVTILHAILLVAGLVVLSWVVGWVKRAFLRPTQDDNLQPVTCISCGWAGRVSRIAGRCPRCNAELGDRLRD